MQSARNLEVFKALTMFRVFDTFQIIDKSSKVPNT